MKEISTVHKLKTKKVKMILDCAEDVDYSKLGKFDTVFTSPPYYNTELYSEDETQSYKKYPEFQDWLENFLFKTLRKVCETLTEDGKLIINIKDSKQYKIVEPMINYIEYELGLEEETRIRIQHAKRYKNNTAYEYIYVFSK